ncbi:unnamed protein product [Aphanomyces euteiches]|uniref:Uncharacterized protein n=1 Tax=Aphanomyces euteiches TaxID=100861 RepID=A0A6G0XUB5_9STRA|nr:hypothetical protein Ae201684_001669 [Aphanomyces euteiches]KAH9075198.1 hypothetical protein Ae201684P_003881 [Aphanomyces euteiches]
MQLWSLLLVPLVAAAASVGDKVFKLKHFRLEDYRHLYNNQSEQSGIEAAATQQWFASQLVDHTDANNKAVWKQQYFVNDQFYGGPGSPVFLFISGEDAINSVFIQGANYFIGELAQENKAMLVALEHRYYGSSQPVPDWSNANLKYLTSEQALADIATFQDYFIKQYQLSTSSPWVAFGGSYSGSLAAWLKLKYPTRFVGSVASSGPIQAQSDFSAYSDVVSNDIKIIGGSTCAQTLQDGLKEFHRLVASTNSNDAAMLKQLFNPCYTMNSDDDRAVLEFSLFLEIIGEAQYNPDNFKSFCTTYLSTSTPTIVPFLQIDRKLVLLQLVLWLCERLYRNYNHHGWMGSSGSATASGVFSPLKYATNSVLLNKLCQSAYGIANVDANVAATNQRYGGLKINVENVVFPSSSYDPWSALALSNSTGVANSKSQVVYIDGGSHCRDMYASRSTDTASVQWAHTQIRAAVKRFLTKK